MTKGVIQYDEKGRPVCELCGKAYDRLLSHVRQVHEMSAYDYKKTFGLDTRKGICSEISAERTRQHTLANKKTVIDQNLISGGIFSRFEKGSEGRTKEKMSEQTRLRLSARVKSEEERKKSAERCYKLGKSGIGNKIRWNKEKESNEQVN